MMPWPWGSKGLEPGRFGPPPRGPGADHVQLRPDERACFDAVQAQLRTSAGLRGRWRWRRLLAAHWLAGHGATLVAVLLTVGAVATIGPAPGVAAALVVALGGWLGLALSRRRRRPRD